MIHNCHRICKKKLQKNRCRHFVAQFILDKRWKFQPNSSNSTPVRSDHAKAVAWTLTQLAANRLHTTQMATLMSNECWSVLEVSIRCRDSAQEVLQAYNAFLLRNNFRKLVFFVFYLSQNWVGVHTTAYARSDCTGVPFELLGWNFQRLSRIDWATEWRWRWFFCNFSSHIRWQLRSILDQTMCMSPVF